MDNKIRKTTTYLLQKALMAEIEKITQDMLFKQVGNPEPARLRAFSQNLPVPETKEADESISFSDFDEAEGAYPFPWALVKLDQGSIPAVQERQHVRVVIVIGVYDNRPENTGHEGILTVFDRIIERFSKNPLLDHQFTATAIDGQDVFRWSMQDEETYPYFYGALEMAFFMPAIQREDAIYG